MPPDDIQPGTAPDWKRLASILAALLPAIPIAAFVMGHNALDQADPAVGAALFHFILAAIGGLALPLLLISYRPANVGYFFIGTAPVAIVAYIAASNYATDAHCGGGTDRAELFTPIAMILILTHIVLSIIALVKEHHDFAYATAFIIGTGLGLAGLAMAISMQFQAARAQGQWEDWLAAEPSGLCIPAYGFWVPLLIVVSIAIVSRWESKLRA